MQPCALPPVLCQHAAADGLCLNHQLLPAAAVGGESQPVVPALVALSKWDPRTADAVHCQDRLQLVRALAL